MERELLFEDSHLKLEHVKNGNYLHEVWRGSTTGDSFYKLAQVIKDNLYKVKPNGLLLDARDHKGLSPEAQKYAVGIIQEYTKEHGTIKEAILMSPDVFSQFSTENYSKKLEENKTSIETKFFDNLNKAEAWLRI